MRSAEKESPRLPLDPIPPRQRFTRRFTGHELAIKLTSMPQGYALSFTLGQLLGIGIAPATVSASSLLRPPFSVAAVALFMLISCSCVAAMISVAAIAAPLIAPANLRMRSRVTAESAARSTDSMLS